MRICVCRAMMLGVIRLSEGDAGRTCTKGWSADTRMMGLWDTWRTFATTISAMVKRGLGIAGMKNDGFRATETLESALPKGRKRTARPVHDGWAEHQQKCIAWRWRRGVSI